MGFKSSPKYLSSALPSNRRMPGLPIVSLYTIHADINSISIGIVSDFMSYINFDYMYMNIFCCITNHCVTFLCSSVSSAVMLFLAIQFLNFKTVFMNYDINNNK